MFVTLDTTHWLMSALNKEALIKAVVFGRRRRKVRCDIDQIKTTKEPPLSTIGKERLTINHVCHI